MPKVIISEPGATPQPYRFTSDHDCVSIGRGSDNDIVISSPSASTSHCTLERVEGGYILRDQNSTNGIKLHGSPMEIIHLEHGMEALIGDVSLAFQLSSEELAQFTHEAPAQVSSAAPGRFTYGPPDQASVDQLKPKKTKKKSIAIISGIAASLVVAGYFLYGPLPGENGLLADSVNTEDKDKHASPEDSNTASGQNAGLMHVSSSNAVPLDPDLLNSFLSSHCTKCHGPEKEKGDLRLDTLSRNVADSNTAQHWQEVLDALNLGEMPPEDEKQPSKEELQAIIKHLTVALDTSKKRLSEDGGNIALRRINRREYKHTIDQLMGMKVLEKTLPPDAITEGYDTIGQDQQFSSHHFEDYFAVAKSIAKVALQWADKDRPKAGVVRRDEVEAEANRRLYRDRKNITDRLARLKAIYDAGEEPKDHGWSDNASARSYANRFPHKLKSINDYLSQPYVDKGIPLPANAWARTQRFGADPRASYQFAIKAGLTGDYPVMRHFMKLVMDGNAIGYLKVSGTQDKPEVQRFDYRPDYRYADNRRLYTYAHVVGSYLAKLKNEGIDTKKGTIWVDAIEVHGPYYGEPSSLERIYKKTIAPVDASKESEALDQQVKAFLKEFSQKAFRGKEANPDYLKQVHNIYRQERKQGKDLKESLVVPLAMVLSSPSFLYLMEDAPTPQKGLVNETEFAHRLSYFLWSRPASGSLLADAQAGKLKDPAVLKQHIDRMLKHKNSLALSEGFFDQWVEMKRFETIGIDVNDHYQFNSALRHSAKMEVQHFFHTMLKENLSLTHLIDSDFLVIDDQLAMHYGLEAPVEGEGFHKVKLPADSPRGGLLGTVAFLSMGSNGERSSPIIRGALIQDKFFNRKPPPPPPNVPELESASDKPLAVKEAIDLHRQKAQCASCHSSFDPLGFGLENFNLVGLWRDKETVGHAGKKGEKPKLIPVRAEGVFPNKKPFHNLDEFRSGLIAHKHLLTRSIAEGLLSYGLGRHIEFADQQALDEICKKAGQNNEQIGDLIYNIISHPLFRRGDQGTNTTTVKR